VPEWERTVDLTALATAIGHSPDQVESAVGDLFGKADLRYRLLAPRYRDEVILSILKRIDGGDLPMVGPQRHALWSDVWQQCLQNFIDRDGDIEALNPAFLGSNRLVRLNQEYAEAASPRFELDLYAIVRQWLYATYLRDIPAAFEFGCGSAFNLVALARLAPQMRLTGLDWAPASVALVDSLADRFGFRMRGQSFDFFKPDPAVAVTPESAVLTFCALEQTGERFEAFLDFLLVKNPAICIHMEPILDFYDAENLVDWLAIKFHTARHYLTGFLPRLRTLESEGRAEVTEARRLGFGSLFHEAFSIVVWRPVAK
jgi:hypothetical protein